LALDHLTIEDGQIALEDQKAGKPRDVYEHIDLDLKGLGPDRRGSRPAMFVWTRWRQCSRFNPTSRPGRR
jgi:hypothetical protein